MGRIEVGKYLVSDPKICHGQLTFKGTRVMVKTILNALQQGYSMERIAQGWPQVSQEAVQEALTLATKALLEQYEAAGVEEIAV